MRSLKWLRAETSATIQDASVLLMLLVAIMCISTVAAATGQCPPDNEISPCKCSQNNEEMQIWCSHGDYSKLSRTFHRIANQTSGEIDELILENNMFVTLPDRAFWPLKIMRLMLRENGLCRISPNWMSGLETTIQEIYMVEPDLSFFPEDSIATLPNLEAITINANSLDHLPSIFGLARLKYVHMEMPSVTASLGDHFLGLPFLEQMHITGCSRMRKLEAEYVRDLPKLSILNFTGCGLNNIHPRSLIRLPALTDLSFTDNQFDDARLVGVAIRDLFNLSTLRMDSNLIDRVDEATFVDIENLRILYLNDNRISMLNRAAFHRLPRLRSLYLQNNNIRTVHPEFFLPINENRVEELWFGNNVIDHSAIIGSLLESFPNLRLLDLSGNSLNDLTFGAIRPHPLMEMLLLNDNRIERVGREVFAGLPSLRELKLTNNSLSNYAMPYWNLPALKGMDLSWNRFDQLDQFVLNGVPSLRRLDMSSNSLRQIEPTAFLMTPHLEFINLSGNQISNVPYASLYHLQKLYDVDFSENNLTQIIQALPKNIEYLRLANNQITQLPSPLSQDFKLPSLKLLHLSNNRIHYIPPGIFGTMCTLRTLELGNNLVQKIEEMSFHDLSHLRVLNLSHNRIIMIHANAFKTLKRLVSLDLNGNRLEVIPSNLFSHNTDLKRIDLSENRLTDIPQAAFASNKKLEELYLAKNSFATIPSSISTIGSLKILNLRDNDIKSLSPMQSAMSSVRELYLSNNKLKTIREGNFDRLPNLSVVHLDNNSIENISSNAFTSLPLLTAVNLSKNKLNHLEGSTFTDLPKLRSVEIQENQLTEIAEDAFTDCDALANLNVSNNLITNMEKVGIASAKSLLALDLSHNRITKFSTRATRNLRQLVMLKLDNNRICKVEGSPFESMSHLRLLSLRDNKMTDLSENTFGRIKSSIMYLDVDGNPVKCSCNVLWLQAWLQRSNVYYPGPRCSDGILLKDKRMTKMDCQTADKDEVIPGCEAKAEDKSSSDLAVEGKDIATTPASSIATNTSEVANKMGDIKPMLDSNNQTASGRTNATTATNGIPPEIMTHFISGDTPTIYAGSVAKYKNKNEGNMRGNVGHMRNSEGHISDNEGHVRKKEKKGEDTKNGNEGYASNSTGNIPKNEKNEERIKENEGLTRNSTGNIRQNEKNEEITNKNEGYSRNDAGNVRKNEKNVSSNESQSSGNEGNARKKTIIKMGTNEGQPEADKTTQEGHFPDDEGNPRKNERLRGGGDGRTRNRQKIDESSSERPNWKYISRNRNKITTVNETSSEKPNWKYISRNREKMTTDNETSSEKPNWDYISNNGMNFFGTPISTYIDKFMKNSAFAENNNKNENRNERGRNTKLPAITDVQKGGFIPIVQTDVNKRNQKGPSDGGRKKGLSENVTQNRNASKIMDEELDDSGESLVPAQRAKYRNGVKNHSGDRASQNSTTNPTSRVVGAPFKPSPLSSREIPTEETALSYNVVRPDNNNHPTALVVKVERNSHEDDESGTYSRITKSANNQSASSIAADNSWYFENYNRSNIEPYIYRSTPAASSTETVTYLSLNICLMILHICL